MSDGATDGARPPSGHDAAELTIGVAIAVPAPYGDQLERTRESFGDPMARNIPAHVTLLPPTSIAADSLPAVHEHLTAVSAAGRPFPMRLRGTDTFRPVSPVVFVRVDEGLDECRRVEAHVRSGVLLRPLAFDYHPHVTVAHDLPDHALDAASTTLSDFDAAFPVTSFRLYCQGGDGQWHVEGEYPLGDGRERP